MRYLVRPVVCAAVGLVALVGCNKQTSSQAGAAGASSSESGNQVVATYAGKKLTQAELDERIADQLFETRRKALDQLIIEDLVKLEAQKRGVTEEQLFKTEITDKIPAPPEDQVNQLWEQNKDRLPPGAKLEDYKEQIVGQLTMPQQQERMRQFVTELRNNAKVEVTLQQPLPPKKEGVEAKGPARGPEGAPVTIVEFSDFQCPFCSRAAETVHQVLEQYPGKVRLYYRHFPLPFHPQAPDAAEAAMCASEQGKFWEMHDALFKNQNELQPEGLKKHAQAVGLDLNKFNACFDQKKFKTQIDEDLEAGKKLGVNGTPAFFINGRMLSGAQPIEEFKRVIDAELARK